MIADVDKSFYFLVLFLGGFADGCTPSQDIDSFPLQQRNHFDEARHRKTSGALAILVRGRDIMSISLNQLFL